MRNQRKTILEANYRRLESLNNSTPLPHIDSDWCWCDPTVEFNGDGDQLVLHKEVTWHWTDLERNGMGFQNKIPYVEGVLVVVLDGDFIWLLEATGHSSLQKQSAVRAKMGSLSRAKTGFRIKNQCEYRRKIKAQESRSFAEDGYVTAERRDACLHNGKSWQKTSARRVRRWKLWISFWWRSRVRLVWPLGRGIILPRSCLFASFDVSLSKAGSSTPVLDHHFWAAYRK